VPPRKAALILDRLELCGRRDCVEESDEGKRDGKGAAKDGSALT